MPVDLTPFSTFTSMRRADIYKFVGNDPRTVKSLEELQNLLSGNVPSALSSILGTSIIAGDGLTGGGTLSADVTLNVGAGTGLIANADDIAIDIPAELERIQDGVGTILTDTATIDFTYDDVTPAITADVKDGSIGTAKLADGGVTLAKQANVATGTVFYRKTSGTGAPEVQTLATLKSDLGLTGTNSGDQSIQTLLDSISSTQGTVLYRSNSGWSALSPGTSGQVLRTNGVGSNPTWAAVGSGTTGGNSLAWPIQGTPVASATSTAAHGVYFTALTDFVVSGLWAQVTTVSGATYRVAIYQVNTSGLISAVVADSADIASPGAVTGTNVGAKFSTPVTLSAGNNYIASFRRTDSTDSVVVGVFGLSTSALPVYTGLPIQYTSTVQTKFATLAKATPAVGDTWTLGGNGYYAISVLYTS
jgi:hypothetical protein